MFEPMIYGALTTLLIFVIVFPTTVAVCWLVDRVLQRQRTGDKL